MPNQTVIVEFIGRGDLDRSLKALRGDVRDTERALDSADFDKPFKKLGDSTKAAAESTGKLGKAFDNARKAGQGDLDVSVTRLRRSSDDAEGSVGRLSGAFGRVRDVVKSPIDAVVNRFRSSSDDATGSVGRLGKSFDNVRSIGARTDLAGGMVRTRAATDDAEKSVGRLGGAFSSVRNVAIGVFGGDLLIRGVQSAVRLFGDARQAAVNMGESLNKNRVVFGDSSRAVEAFASTAAKSLGLSRLAALDATGTFGNMFVQLGFGVKPAADMSMSMLRLAADLASFHNADPTDVIMTMGAAFRGEYDSVQRFIPTITAAAVEQQALQMGLAGSAKELNANDKALATYQLLIQGAGKATGDFARTSDQAANQQRILRARWEDLKATLGTLVIPALGVAIGAINNALDTLERGFRAAGEAARRWHDEMVAAGAGLSVFATIAGAGPAIVGITSLLTKLGAALGAVAIFVTSTVGIIAIAVAAIVAGLVYAYLKFEGFRNVVDAVWRAVIGFFQAAARKIVPILQGIGEWVGKISGMFGGVASAVGDALSGVVRAVSGVVAGVGAAFGAMGRVISTVWNGVVMPVLNAIASTVGGAIGVAFRTLASVASAAFGAIGVAVRTAWNIIEPILRPFAFILQNVTIPALHALRVLAVAVFKDLADVVRNAIGLAVTVITGMVGFIRANFMPTIQALGSVFSAVWNTVGSVVSTVWRATISVVWSAIVAYVQGYLVPIFRTFQQVAEMVWRAVGNVVGAAWNSVLRPVWSAIQSFIHGALVPVFQTFRSVAESVWNRVTSVIASGYNSTIRPVFDAIRNTINGVVIPAFQTMVNAVGRAWDSFTGAARSAWNGVTGIIRGSLGAIGGVVQGFLRVVARIASVVGLGHIADALNRGADAAATWGRASGGAISARPGEPPAFGRGTRTMPTAEVGPGFVTPGARAIVGEGNPSRPEYVVPTDPRYRPRAVALYAQLGEDLGLVPEMAIGGIIGNIVSWASDKVMDVWQKVREVGANVVDKLWPTLDTGDQTNLAAIFPQSINSVRARALEMIRGSIEKKMAEEGPAIGTGGFKPGQGNWPPPRLGVLSPNTAAAANFVRRTWGVTVGTLGKRANKSDHPYGKALDAMVYNDRAKGNAIANWFVQNPGVYGTKYVIWLQRINSGNGWRAMGDRGSPTANHMDHPHVSFYEEGGRLTALGGLPANVYDNGGYLPPGWSLAGNFTGKREPVGGDTHTVTMTVAPGAVQVDVRVDAGVDTRTVAREVEAATSRALRAMEDEMVRRIRTVRLR